MNEGVQERSKLIRMSSNMSEFEGAVTGRRGMFCADVMHVINPDDSQAKLLGMVKLGLRYYDSVDKIDLLKHPIEVLTGQIDLISRGKDTEPHFEGWQKCEKKSPYSYSQTYFWR